MLENIDLKIIIQPIIYILIAIVAYRVIKGAFVRSSKRTGWGWI